MKTYPIILPDNRKPRYSSMYAAINPKTGSAVDWDVNLYKAARSAAICAAHSHKNKNHPINATAKAEGILEAPYYIVVSQDTGRRITAAEILKALHR